MLNPFLIIKFFMAANNSEKISENIHFVSSDFYYTAIGGAVLLGLGLAAWAYKSNFFYMRKPVKVDTPSRPRHEPVLTPELLMTKYKEKRRILRKLDYIENAQNISDHEATVAKCACYDRIKQLEQGLDSDTLMALEIMERIMDKM